MLEFVDDWNEQVLHVKGGMDVEGMEDVNEHRIGLFVENENEPMALKVCSWRAEDVRRRVEEWCVDWSDCVNGEKKEG